MRFLNLETLHAILAYSKPRAIIFCLRPLLLMRNLLLLVFLVLPAGATDLIFDTFESDGFGEWLVEGDAFGKAPTAVTPQGVNGKITGYSGQYSVSSAHDGD
ncbi:MAG TPA: hypothetical protein DCG41_02110, partial [Verrucomicrobiales bacterium]|nr:hypothetical protein [Verrucomicrobiales bacterium]